MDNNERSLPAGEFKARCLKLMDDVRKTRRPVVITKRGKPVAKLVPVDDRVAPLFGRLRGTAAVEGDIVGPTGVPWHAGRGVLYVGDDEA